MKSTPINVGQVPQTFIDNYAIEMVNFATRTMHQPKKHDQNPLVRKDKPWEQVPFFRTNTWNVHWDEREQLYKFWYEDVGWDYDRYMDIQRSLPEQTVPEFAGMEPYEKTVDNRILYAESRDGIHWDKPLLDYRTVDGQRTNICFGSEEHGKIHACSVLLDPLETDETHRFKAMYWTSKLGLSDSGIASAFSADGRQWTPYDEPLLIGQITERQLGDVIILSADTVTGEYYLDTRSRAMQEPPLDPKHPMVRGWGPPHYPHDPWTMAKRRVFSSNSRDINYWPVLKEMLVPDNVEDNLDDEFYGLVRFRMGDLYVGFLNVFRRTHNTMNVHLVCSRDGYQWQRVSRGRPFLEVSPEGSWDCYMNEICNAPLFLEDEVRIYYGGASVHHDWWMYGEKEGLDVPEAHPGWGGGETALGLATLRPEGFVSIDTTVREGILVTRPFVSDGNRLLLNVACGPKGYLDVELADANDDVVPGYERSACDTHHGDSTRHVVSWGGKPELPRDVMAKGAKLRFYSRHCSLFTFTVADEKALPIGT